MITFNKATIQVGLLLLCWKWSSVGSFYPPNSTEEDRFKSLKVRPRCHSAQFGALHTSKCCRPPVTLRTLYTFLGQVTHVNGNRCYGNEEKIFFMKERPRLSQSCQKYFSASRTIFKLLAIFGFNWIVRSRDHCAQFWPHWPQNRNL